MKFWTTNKRKPGEGIGLSVFDPYTLARFKDRIVPMRYRFEFGNSTKVRVLQFEYLMFGTLSL